MRIILIIIRITILKEIVTNNEHYFLPSNGTRRLAAGGTLLTFKLRGVNVRFCLKENILGGHQQLPSPKATIPGPD